MKNTLFFTFFLFPMFVFSQTLDITNFEFIKSLKTQSQLNTFLLSAGFENKGTQTYEPQDFTSTVYWGDTPYSTSNSKINSFNTIIITRPIKSKEMPIFFDYGTKNLSQFNLLITSLNKSGYSIVKKQNGTVGGIILESKEYIFANKAQESFLVIENKTLEKDESTTIGYTFRFLLPF